jgi:hypothetical protein
MLRRPVRAFLTAASAISGYSVDELTGPCRRQAIVVWRHAVILLASREGHSSLLIGRVLNRDHTCVPHVLYHLRPAHRERVDSAAARITEYLSQEPARPTQPVTDPPAAKKTSPASRTNTMSAWRRIAHWYGDVRRVPEAEIDAP